MENSDGETGKGSFLERYRSDRNVGSGPVEGTWRRAAGLNNTEWCDLVVHSRGVTPRAWSEPSSSAMPRWQCGRPQPLEAYPGILVPRALGPTLPRLGHAHRQFQVHHHT
jgi:hypothetical protein